MKREKPKTKWDTRNWLRDERKSETHVLQMAVPYKFVFECQGLVASSFPAAPTSFTTDFWPSFHFYGRDSCPVIAYSCSVLTLLAERRLYTFGHESAWSSFFHVACNSVKPVTSNCQIDDYIIRMIVFFILPECCWYLWDVLVGRCYRKMATMNNERRLVSDGRK